MPQVRLRVNRWLVHHDDGNPTKLEEFSVCAAGGDSIQEVIRRFAATNEVFRRAVFDENGQLIQAGIVIIVNGRIINPYDPSEPTLKEDDEILVLSMVAGG
ncbi:MAG: MoaD/ThiS family protein [Thermodesulfobacteriota bacterium]|nr:MoaD/ThiS family protein [Thermodesulfobacteriota bacterium]